ncbi:NOL1/NOP2/sun family putative RNA methylase [Oscillatoria sp. CS-180]|uniref:NOL1/NOP2/sun family putative RNA methylase n=1 Tax=Oscillatoria sp. CS-180 TaxID=3021720 RepID=UPI0023305ABE|nr:NOL1/NOP2/sun family putative RNA methylase [Oscillatoria sp. CS-180]MDB9525720.1 NOL1/NOP2/sun family putative RNA methylase [Oscillatoria sp. CS-180]
MSHTDLWVRSRGASNEVLAILARYAAIVDDPQAFLDSSQQPLPICLWTNPLKSTPKALQHYLQGLGVRLEPVNWMPGAFRTDAWSTPGRTLAFTAGWYYVQEEIAMAAVAALDPQPGETILDLCAAPGGKMAQIATRQGETGCVIANEIHRDRLPSLSVTVARLGLTSVITTQADGRSLPLAPHTFDRVLVDAPCSGEGNLRRRQHPQVWQPTYGARIATAQKKLLSRALDLVKPGGTVVYSTCTFAPEENEAVLDAVLGDRAWIEPFTIPELRGQPGLTQWQGQSYRQDIVQARRYFPHFNNTGGFFVAKLRRANTQLCSFSPLVSSQLPPVALVPGNPVDTLRKRFAIAPDVFPTYTCWATGKRRLWLASGASLSPSQVRPQSYGIPLATNTNLGLKPSTAFLQRFGHLIQRNKINLPNEEAASLFLQGKTQPVKSTADFGYVHVQFQEFELGCGRYTNGQLQSQLPKTLRWLATPLRPKGG